MRHQLARSALAVLIVLGLISCGETATDPISHIKGRAAAFDAIPLVGSKVVISQVYGGGGNSGATLKNDFIELYNGSPDAVDLTSASVQYASSTGSSWQVTNLSGTLQPGQYYLIQETAGAGGTVSLPTPDASGGILMSATAGKVALVNSTTGLSGTGCPLTPDIVDFVGFGTGTNCSEGTGPTATLSNTTAAIRKSGGQQDTDNNAADFVTGAPSPRNTASPTLLPADPLTARITPKALAAFVGDNVNYIVTARKDFHSVAITSATWSSTAVAVATIDPTTGVAQAVDRGLTTIAVTVTTPEGNLSASTSLAVGRPIVPSTTVVSEIHYDNTGTDTGEQVEIQGDAGASLDGWSLVLYDGNGGAPYTTTPLSGTIPATCGTRGVVVLSYPVNGIQNGSPDGWALVNADGNVTEFNSYEGRVTASAGPALGLVSTDIGRSEPSTSPIGQSLQRAGNDVWFGPIASTFGACNADTPVLPPGTISVQARSARLPVAFQTQLFLNNGSIDHQGHPVGNSGVTWSTSDESIVAVNATTGVITAKGVGTATLTATAKSDGTTGSTPITTYVAPIGGASVRIDHNAELGTPTDADPSDDIIIARRQYTLSYNASHGDPNWVSWNLDASHTTGGGVRCNCFTADPGIAALGLPAYDTNDWINGGVWSRGHMSPSADWLDADGDNAPTFYLSNMLPQNQTLNGGAWGNLENHLRDLATGTTEIYIVAGGIFTKNRGGAGVDGFGFMNSSGHIAVPDSVWKIAIVVPDGRSASGITGPSDVQVIAAKFPNDVSGTGTWNRYATPITEIQKSTGYDFLSALPEGIQCQLEARNCAPTARVTSSISANGWQTNEGQTVTFSAATSSDPNAGDILSYTWDVNGVTVGTGPTLDYTFANDGLFAVGVHVSDGHGGTDARAQDVTVLNVAPTLSAFAGAALLRGETYGATGNFSDPGADMWTATVNYGDGSGTASLPLSGQSFSLTHTYANAGSFTVTVSVNDGLATTSGTAIVVVKSAVQGIADLEAAVEALGTSNGFNRGQVNSLQMKLENATKQLAAGKTTPALNMLDAFLNELDADVRRGSLSEADAAPIVALAHRVINSINAP